MDLEAGTLYMVATPIGNLADITLRALEVLQKCQVVYAEDTRVSRKLFERHAVNTSLYSFRQSPNRSLVERGVQEIIHRLAEGQTVGYITDAGTPGISDPGGYLVQRVRQAGYPVAPIPGASSVTALLSVAGIPARAALTVGFLAKKKGRQSYLAKLRSALESGLVDAIVLMESPERIVRLLTEVDSWQLPELSVCLGRELSKLHEEILSGTVAEVKENLSKRKQIKGEITLVLYIASPQVDTLI